MGDNCVSLGPFDPEDPDVGEKITNAFESSDAPIPEVQDPITAAKIAELDIKINKIQNTNTALRAMGLHNTADLNTRKLQRLLQEKRDLQEG